MYAIISDSGRQFKVEKGQEFEVDYRDVQAGDKITFDNVLAISSEGGLKLGKPTVSGASVTAEVLGADGRQARDPQTPPPQELASQDGSPPDLYRRSRRRDQRCGDGDVRSRI